MEQHVDNASDERDHGNDDVTIRTSRESSTSSSIIMNGRDDKVIINAIEAIVKATSTQSEATIAIQLMEGRRMDVTAKNARRVMESIKYLSSSSATKDAMIRLKYWRQGPLLSDGMKVENQMVMDDGEWNKFKGFLMIDRALNKANVELMLLKRLNYVSLWTTVKAMMDGSEDDKKALREAKV